MFVTITGLTVGDSAWGQCLQACTLHLAQGGGGGGGGGVTADFTLIL